MSHEKKLGLLKKTLVNDNGLTFTIAYLRENRVTLTEDEAVDLRDWLNAYIERHGLEVRDAT